MSSRQKEVILLVEDDVFIEIVEKQMIHRLGYEVITANSSQTAVEMALNNDKIDLILMAINLGRGFDGPEAAAKILRERDLPIVFVTAHTEKEYVDKLKKVTCYGCILKASGEFVLNSAIEIALKLFKEKQNLLLNMELLRQREEIYRDLFSSESNTLPDNRETGPDVKNLGCRP
jgi:CheY-like chemotaxis protein